MTGSEIVKHDNGRAAALAVPIRGVDDLLHIGSVLAASGFFKNTAGEAQAAAKILAGMELGIAPVAALRGLYIVEGQISLAYPLIGALIKKSGRYDYRIREKTAEACVVEFFESNESVGLESLTMKQAKERGLDQYRDKNGQMKTKEPWRKFPENMLLSKCMSNGAKAYCSEVFFGSVYTPDELGAEVDGATGAVVELEALPGIEYSQCEADGCGALIQDHEYEDGRKMSAAKIEEGTRAAYGKALCWDCAQEAKAAKAEADKGVQEPKEEPLRLELKKINTEPAQAQGSTAKALTSARTRYNIVAAYATSLGMKAPEHKASHTASQLEEMIRSLSAEVIDAINAVALINESVPDEAIPNDSATFKDWTAFVAAYGLMEAIKAEIASLEESEELEEEAAY